VSKKSVVAARLIPAVRWRGGLQAQFQFVAQGLLEIEVANEAELGDKRQDRRPANMGAGGELRDGFQPNDRIACEKGQTRASLGRRRPAEVAADACCN